MSIPETISFIDPEWKKMLVVISDGMKAYMKVAGKREKLGTQDVVNGFAFCWATKEAIANGYDPLRVIERRDLAKVFYLRNLEWRRARLQWHAYEIRTKCPDAEHPDKGVAEGAFAGWLYSDPTSERGDARINDFMAATEKSEAAKRAFFKMASNPIKQTSRHPDVDSWLILIWPVVTGYGWTYRDVTEAAKIKFGNLNPFSVDDDLAKHCRMLGLRVTGRAGTRKKPQIYSKDVQPRLFDFVQDPEFESGSSWHPPLP